MGGNIMNFSVTKEHYTINAQVNIIGFDMIINITGGDTPHIGTVTTLTKNTDLQTIRYPSHDGRFHKDDILAIKVGEIIKPLLPASCTITSGVHVNHISQKQIDVSSDMAENLGHQIKSWLSKTKIVAPSPTYYRNNENPI